MLNPAELKPLLYPSYMIYIYIIYIFVCINMAKVYILCVFAYSKPKNVAANERGKVKCSINDIFSCSPKADPVNVD